MKKKLKLQKIETPELLNLNMEIFTELNERYKEFIDTYLPKDYKTITLTDDSYTLGTRGQKINFILTNNGRLFGVNQNLEYYQGNIIRDNEIILLKGNKCSFSPIHLFTGKLDLIRGLFTGNYWQSSITKIKESQEFLFYLNNNGDQNNSNLSEKTYNSIIDKRIAFIEILIAMAGKDIINIINNNIENTMKSPVKQLKR